MKKNKRDEHIVKNIEVLYKIFSFVTQERFSFIIVNLNFVKRKLGFFQNFINNLYDAACGAFELYSMT